ncbi:MAG TPA: solute carrier family 23 protein [Stellaceae bacterium]
MTVLFRSLLPGEKAAAKPAEKREPAVRPSNLVYAVDERPPALPLLVSALQHVMVIGSIGAIFPLLVLDAAGASREMTERVMSISLLTLGIATLLLCYRSRFLGSGYLLPSVFTAAYLPVSITAAKTGGWPLVCGMTIFAGAVELVLSQLVQRLRPYLPTEIAGFAVLMIGLTLGVLGFNLITGVSAAGEAMGADAGTQALLGIACIGVMVALNVWGSKSLRLYCCLIGLALGYAVAVFAGMIDFSSARLSPATAVFPPLPGFGWPTISAALMLPFAVSAIACSLRAIGDITTCQKINDANWQRPNMATLRNGIAADGLGTIVAGLLGTVGVNSFSGSVGLSIATGVTSRVVGYATGVLFIVISFLPPVSDLIALMPRPLMGAILIFTACFIMLSGMQVITSRLMDGRRTVVIGAALLLGFSRYLFPTFYAAAPAFLLPAVSSPMVLGLLTALLLNLVFRIGIKKTAEIAFTPGIDELAKLEHFGHDQGGKWGARRDVMARVVNAMIEAAECLPLVMMHGQSARFALRFDEYRLDLMLTYVGEALTTRGPAPSPQELLDDEKQLTRLAVMMMRRLATRMIATSSGTTQHVTLNFDQ